MFAVRNVELDNPEGVVMKFIISKLSNKPLGVDINKLYGS